MNGLSSYKSEFIQFAAELNAMTFGEFVLKSGRKSPWFFNSGSFDTGQALAQLGKYYATAIVESKLEFDVLFGPAYKGIPLATIVATALYEHHDISKLVSYNRKETKDHGEGGDLIGAPVSEQKALIIDDVITAGTAFCQSEELINRYGGTTVGACVIVDRQEVGHDLEQSAIQQINDIYSVPVLSIIKFDDVITHFTETGENSDLLQKMTDYLHHCGAERAEL